MCTLETIRKVIQLVELEEFAIKHKLDPKSNEAVNLWISDGHAALFAEHFTKARSDIEAHCLARCHGSCLNSPYKCKLRKEIHNLMKDKRNW